MQQPFNGSLRNGAKDSEHSIHMQSSCVAVRSHPLYVAKCAVLAFHAEVCMLTFFYCMTSKCGHMALLVSMSSSPISNYLKKLLKTEMIYSRSYNCLIMPNATMLQATQVQKKFHLLCQTALIHIYI
jgi:hypothetical protein